MKNLQFCFTLSHEDITLRLKNRVECLEEGSNSAILTMSKLINKIFPNLAPPTVDSSCRNQIWGCYNHVDLKESHYYHPYEQPWNNFIIESINNGQAVYFQSTLYIVILLPITEEELFQTNPNPDQQTYFQKLTLTNSNLSMQQRISQIFQIPLIAKSTNKIGIFFIQQNIQVNVFAPKIDQTALFMGNLYNNDRWTIINVGEKNIPTIEQLINFDCIIIPGNILSVLSYTPHIISAVANLDAAYRANRKLKILAICFGHQLIAQHFKALIVKKQRKGGLQKINIDQNIAKKYSFLEPIFNRDSLFISEHHEDYVEDVPEGFDLLATSQSCKVQSLISKDGRILTSQFHCQYSCRFTEIYTKKKLHYLNSNSLPYFYIPDHPDKQKMSFVHSKLILQVFRKFIEYDVQVNLQIN